MRSLFVSGLLVGGVGLSMASSLPGTSSLDAGAGGGTTDVAAFVAGWCEQEMRCEAEKGKSYVNKQACLDSANMMFTCGFPVSGELRMRYELDPARAAECLQGMQALACSASPSDALRETCGEAMKVHWAGGNFTTAGANQKCGAFTPAGGEVALCDTGLYCKYSRNQDICNVCLQKKAVGDDCTYGNWGECPADSDCDQTTSKCQAYVYSDAGGRCANGETCRNSFCKNNQCLELLARNAPCTGGGECSNSLVCRGGVCTDKLDIDGDCSSGDSCLSGLVCAAGRCKHAPITCAPLAVGASCGPYGECVDTAYCGANGTCLARVALNGSCTGTECAAGLFCKDNVCSAYAAINASCASPERCDPATAFCDSAAGNVCTAHKAVSASCGAIYGECGTDAWCNTTSQVCVNECTMP